ncbi:RING/U-box superfamily protein, partial [Striga asiatica]
SYTIIDLDPYQKQVYCAKKNKHRKGQNMGVACLDTDEVSSGRSIIKGNVCLAIHELKKMSNCIHCGAMKFQYECPTFCCDNGKVKLAPIEVPDELYELFTSQTEEAKQFRINIRLFNRVKLDKELASARQGVYTFRAQGVVYHDLPSLLPKEDGPRYFQLYFRETEREVENRMGIFPNSSLSKSTVNKLITVLDVNLK